MRGNRVTVRNSGQVMEVDLDLIPLSSLLCDLGQNFCHFSVP